MKNINDNLSEIVSISATTITGTTFYGDGSGLTNVPSTFNGGTITGATNFTGGLSATTISATTYQNLPTDVTVTGGTYNQSTQTATFTNNTGGTFNISGFTTNKGSFGITIDGGGSAITTGVKGYITIPYAGTITGWDIFADTSGSIVVDVWKDTYANFPPTVADTIAGTEKPTLTSATKNQDTNLTTWTTSVTANDVIAFNVDSVSTVTRINLIIYINKS